MPKMTGGRIAEDTLWACTTCGACQEVCPVFIEHPLKILQMRQNLVLEQEKTPPELQRTYPQHRAPVEPVGHRATTSAWTGRRTSTSRRSRTTPTPSTSCGSAAPARSTAASSSRRARW